MLWRSVVGKLWFTIILLVSFVLTVLMVMLLQFFERFHVNEAESQLLNHANMIATIYEEYDDRVTARMTITEYANAFEKKVVIIEDRANYWSTGEAGLVNLPLEVFVEHPMLSQVFQGERAVVTEDDFSEFYRGDSDTGMMIVGIPLHLDDGNDAVFLYQPLATIEETSAETKRIVYFSAGIAIVLTTVFAFFLSSRITSPLRKMRQVALEVAQGKFNTKVPILTHDEIGQLAIAFNRMRRELNRNVTELNQEKEQLSRILSSMADGVITLDKRGKVMVTNPPAERFIQAWHYEQGLVPSEKNELPQAIHQLYQQVVALESEQMTELDVQGRSWAILMTPLYDNSYVRGAVAVIRDMTEERRHDKLRKDFIANVSHELRTPISMLQGYSEAIIDDIAGTDQEKKELAKIIYDESLRMGRLVNELLDLARMEAGHIDLSYEEIEVKTFCERITRKFQGLAKEQQLTLDFIYRGDEGKRIQVDPDRLEQVLTNLLSNAIRHTDPGGTVQLACHVMENGVKIDVTDTGTGIPEEDLPYVFERFYKADKARTRGRSGTGLGLAIVKNIVDAHSGEISVHSKQQEGTTFTAFFPNARTIL
ncbi:ATP-binding protein [Halalkalibacterium halodurans]|jgi:two-component system sensor histidine kinase ResE|uniref:histidine kinase n=1 Tax=Halalkalibacterium halodurans (strain ATCC BAA-125 / DSM 18197 / FERM 7344 / JCM 9153 / C-125) TaxID=272558 RepID=Q9KCJ0_HALH5|nr:ATP-binding protein [Halalkalibacterium halodurans]MED4081846.1 ATP-binding protein [Halalkalibacterium halodurans]MED4086417.1 ATP-binding protein [Halalkalibacterium halodurans]MED4105047.1 ATP-binding protein [Halalkalibacterium halodurans]MED4110773.1 ATP-binding protein [Halalkalibacterium halodurans]MED4147545.1 ATP-binding protein [Halalkalibacterium halodurans]